MNTFYHPRLFYDGSSDAALISGSSQIAASAINAMSVSGSSSKDRQFMKDMYAQQRADALADRDYANPTNTMARLKAGGLNPNLVYGSGIGNTAPIKGASFVPYHRTPPDIGTGVGNAVSAFFGTKIQLAQLNNMEAQNQVLQAQAKNIDVDTQLKGSQTTKTQSEITLNQFEIGLKNTTRDALIAIKNGEANKLAADVTYTLDKNQREAISNVVSVKEGLTRILNLDAQRANTIAEKQEIAQKIDLLNKDNQLKQLDIDYIRSTGNTGRPNEGAIPKMVEYLYGHIMGSASQTHTPTNLPRLEDDSLYNMFQRRNMDSMKSGDWKKYTK